MSNTLFPTSIDAPTDPTSANTLNNPPHHLQHGFANDAIVAIENVLGVTGSVVSGTVAYILGGISAGDKAASLTGAQTLTNKILGSGAAINLGSDGTGDIYYRNSGGLLARLPIGSNLQVLSVAGGIPVWINNPAASNGSITVAGVFQEATQANTDAGTQTGSTGADLAVTPNTLRARLVNSGVVDTGSANAYVITPSPPITAYAAYQQFSFKAINANTAASTLNVSGLGTQSIKKNGTTALVAGDIPAGSLVLVEYDGTNFQLLNPATVTSTVARGILTFSSTTPQSPTLTFLPKVIRVAAYCADTNALAPSSNGGWDATNGNTSISSNGSGGAVCYSLEAASSNGITGVISSVSATSFTVTPSFSSSSVTHYVYWEAQA